MNCECLDPEPIRRGYNRNGGSTRIGVMCRKCKKRIPVKIV